MTTAKSQIEYEKEVEARSESIKILEVFAPKLFELKQMLIAIPVKVPHNVRIAIEKLDDAFLRAREAIFNDLITEDQKTENTIQ